MKKFGWFVLLALLVAGCGQQEKKAVDPLAYAVITGHIKNRQVYPQEHSLKVVIPSFWNAQTVVECEIKEDDSFSFRFQPLALRDISIETFVPYLLVRPGDSLHIELDFSRLNWVDFSGSAADLNQDLYAFTDGKGYYLRQNAGTDDDLLSPDAFKAKMDRERDLRLERFQAFLQGREVDPDLQKWIGKGLEKEYYMNLLTYRFRHLFMTGDTVPADFYGFKSGVEDLFADDVIHSGLFELSTQYQYLVQKKTDTIVGLSQRLSDIADCTNNKVLSQFMLAGILDESLASNEVTDFEDNRTFFDEHITLPVLREPLLQKYKDKKAYLANPKPMSDAMLYGVNLENGAASVVSEGMKKLQDVVNRNKGKVVLVNFWGGCPAACVELEPQNKLVEAYQGKEVELVSISEDDEWVQDYARKVGLKGQSYFWSGKDLREIRQSWHVTWSPYYLLINKEGIIVDYGSHIRPSALRTKAKIDRLLEE